MVFEKQQSLFDKEKWYDSIVAGEDRCGTYEFCSSCDKWEEYPCARAMRRYKKGYIRLATVYRSL